MLFNSYQFIFLFLPVTLIGYFALGRIRTSWAAGWLASASLFFYGYWDYRFLPLLIGSILFNYIVGGQIIARRGSASARHLLLLGIVVNLCVLAYFKYANFFVDSVAAMSGKTLIPYDIILPAGISFFTFTQIAFLADASIGKATEYNFTNYVLFVTYFPHLIAGPILHHKEMMPQFAAASTYRWLNSNFAVGITIFVIGLAKKVLIADNIAPHANALFGNPGTPSLLVAWGGALAYTFQLYFDFSGYSDMAIGLSRMFGVNLPLNFDSPYKARNISDFWRRWHMTLSRFLREYLYIPLGGNRKGPLRRYANLFITMLLGGLWHGAGWTFVAWGALHGLYLIINHAWQALWSRPGATAAPSGRLYSAISVAITFLAVVVAWVFFRAHSFQDAGNILAGMAGANGVAIPGAIFNSLGPLQDSIRSLGITTFLGGGQRFIETYVWITIGAALAFLTPNTQEIIRRFNPALDFDDHRHRTTTQRIVWSPTTRWALTIGTLATVCVMALNRPTEFLYFQF